ncbi:unnamed protein product [Camellia sinensis]
MLLFMVSLIVVTASVVFLGSKNSNLIFNSLLSLATLPPSPSPFATIGSKENQAGKKEGIWINSMNGPQIVVPTPMSARIEQKYSNLERLEASLGYARAAIREAITTSEDHHTTQDPEYTPTGPIYWNATAFHRQRRGGGAQGNEARHGVFTVFVDNIPSAMDAKALRDEHNRGKPQPSRRAPHTNNISGKAAFVGHRSFAKVLKGDTSSAAGEESIEIQAFEKGNGWLYENAIIRFNTEYPCRRARGPHATVRTLDLCHGSKSEPKSPNPANRFEKQIFEKVVPNMDCFARYR